MQPNLALYRRYRPETFAEVIGQDHVTGPLRTALAKDRVSHAYLFSGPRGCGKTTSARILARALNCERAPIAEPCGECRSCRDLARGGGGSVDVIEIDAASHGGVDDARDLRERAFFAPVASRYKVYIIDEAHMVTTQGFNALLKLVEEPPEHLKFIFATTEPEKVIPTIRSRTHHYPFRLIPPRVLSDYLAEICAREGVPIEPAALPLVVRAGAGSARDSLSVLDQLLGGADEAGVTYQLATRLLGFTPDTLLDEVVDAFAAGDGGSVFSVVDKVIETGQDPRRFTEDVLRRLRDLVIVAAVPDASASGLLDVPEDQAERLVAQAARFGKAELVRAADCVAEGLTQMRGATTPRLLLELICARVLLPAADHGHDGLAPRLDRLERRIGMTAGLGLAEPAAAAPAPAPETHPETRPETPAAAAPVPQAPAAPAPASPRDPETAVAAESAAKPEPVESAGPAPAAAEEPATPPATPPATQPSAEPVPGGATPAGMGLAEVRRAWPDLLDRVKDLRRFTWILLSQNAQVVALEGRELTLGFKNAGARDSFLGSGSDDILRQAAHAALGVDWRIEAIVDPSTDPGAGTAPVVTRPAVAAPEPPADPAPPAEAPRSADAPDQGPPPPWATDEGPADPSPPARAETARGLAEARERIAPTRTGGAPVESDDRDTGVDRDDPVLEDPGMDATSLLERELDATVIDEIAHD